LNGLGYKEGTQSDFELENKSRFRKINYRLRDAVFSSRYWGEPFQFIM
jgi:hypothetical protein